MTGIGTDGSEYWRNVFFALAGGWVLVSFLRGWMQGILRQLLVPLAVFGASLVLVLITPVASGFLYQNAWLPASTSALLLGVAIWLFAYNLLVFVGGIVFKRTRDQDFAILRLVFGVGGAAVAVVYASPDLGHRDWDSDFRPDRRGPDRSAAYRRLDQSCQLLANPRAIGRLLEFPALRGVWENPRIRTLQADPEILEAVRRGDFLSILSNPKVLALWTDPNIRALLSGDQIQAACDYAKEEAKP